MSGALMVIVLLTFNRPEYAAETLRSTLELVKYDGPIGVHIADDGTPDDFYVPTLMDLANLFGCVTTVTASNSYRRGYGANFNIARQVIMDHQPDPDGLRLVLEDDWRLVRPLDIDALASPLLEGKGNCVRLGYIGFTQALHAKFLSSGNRFFLELDPTSPEPHVFAGHPRLETRGYEDTVGDWPEGLPPGETEFEVAHIPAAREGVLWPFDVHPRGDLYQHIGSVRSTDHEVDPDEAYAAAKWVGQPA